MKALVTGGAGFIGHHLVRTLIGRGDDVVVLDNFATGRRSRLDGLHDKIRLVEGDVRDPVALDRATGGCEVVFHHADLASVAGSVRDPTGSNDVTTTGTIEVMLAAGRARVRRVVFAGSSAVYGDSTALPSRETQPPNPLSPYAAGKLAAEFYVHALGSIHGIETVVLRYFNVFGPGQDPDSEYAAVVPRFITAALQGDRPVIYGDGTQSRDFVFIENVVLANMLAASAAGASGTTCNIGSGERASLLDLLLGIGAAMGQKLSADHAPRRPGDVLHSLADISRARERLGYEVQVSFEEGIGRTVAGYSGQARPIDEGRRMTSRDAAPARTRRRPRPRRITTA